MVRRKSNCSRKLRKTAATMNSRSFLKQNGVNSTKSAISNVTDVRIGHEVITRGTIHQGDAEFDDFSRGRQCTANATMAILMAHVVQLGTWNESTIDTVLRLGDKLYIDSIKRRKVPHGHEINPAYLRVTELKTDVEFGGTKINVIIDEQLCIDGSITLDIEGFPNLRNALNIFFNEYPYGVLTAKGFSLAIFKYAGFFWIFDSHARGRYGRQPDGGRSAACLTRLNNIQALYDLLACNLSLSSLSQVLTDSQYTITPIFIAQDKAFGTGNTCASFKSNTSVAQDEIPVCISDTGKLRSKDQKSTSQHEVVLCSPDNTYVSSKSNEKFDNDDFISQFIEIKSKEDQLDFADKKGDNLSVKRKDNADCVSNHKKVKGNISESPMVPQSQASNASIKRKNNEACISSPSHCSNSDGKHKNHKEIKIMNKTLCNLQTSQSDENVGCSEVILQDRSTDKSILSEVRLDSIDQNLNMVKKQFEKSIGKFANVPCNVCNRMFYLTQTCTLYINDGVRLILPRELHDLERITTCNRCFATIKKHKCPPQAFWNAMYLDPIPDVITCLTDVEKRLISMVVPFTKIIKLGGRFGQYGFKGQAVLFAQDVEEVVEQLPVSITSAGIAIVCEHLENVAKAREFQVDVKKLWSALVWLKANNPLYRNVHIDYSNTSFDLSQICQVMGAKEPTTNGGYETLPQINTGITNIKNSRGIVRGSFHQGDENFSELSRNNQGTAIAAVAISMSHIVALPSWTNSTVETVLICGDRLYTESIDKRNLLNTTERNVQYLAVTELHQTLEILENVCYLSIDDTESVYGLIDRDNSTEGFRNLSNGLQLFVNYHQAGILIANGISLAVFKSLGYFWMFDSHSRGPNGRKASKKGAAFLMRFESLESLYKLIKCNLPKSSNNANGNHQYSLTPLRVLIQPVNQLYLIPERPESINEAKHTQSHSDRQTNNSSHSQCNEVTDNAIMTSILRPIDECIPRVESVVCGGSNYSREAMNNIPLKQLRRKTAPPLQSHVERRAEELAWFYLFPKGCNGLHEPTRQIQITPLDYCQARIMSMDRRFQRTDYLFYALSVMEFYRARQNVGVCLRFRQGDTRPEGLVQNLYLNMRGLRGSNAYWQTACGDLVAMVRNLGPPTWFITLSCNDLNWCDMLKACLVAAGRDEENPEDLSWAQKMKLIEESPVTISRQFMIRLNAIMRILKRDDNILGGKLVDFWWRIEFQNRGSPHLHMVCWNEEIPSFETPAGLALIDKVVSCNSRPQSAELAAIVQRVQVHRHSLTCYKNRRNGECRFGFPRQVSKTSKILDADATVRNKGRFCVLKRDFADVFVNNYNSALLYLWGGNMDIQPCGNMIAIAYYIAKYAAKSEPQDVGDAIRDVLRRIQRYGGDVGRQLFAVSMAILRHRQVSAPECAFRLCHLKLKDSSRKVVFVNTCLPEERYRMLKSNGNEGQVHINIFDRYISRPDDLEELSLAEFAVTYEHIINRGNQAEDDLGDYEAYDEENKIVACRKKIRLKNGMCMKHRTRKAILKVRHYTQAGNREGYFYSYLVAHLPFRNEDELVRDYETAEAAFNAKYHLLRPLLQGATVQEFQHVERELH